MWIHWILKVKDTVHKSNSAVQDKKSYTHLYTHTHTYINIVPINTNHRKGNIRYRKQIELVKSNSVHNNNNNNNDYNRVIHWIGD